jgi:hypothetical protein
VTDKIGREASENAKNRPGSGDVGSSTPSDARTPPSSKNAPEDTPKKENSITTTPPYKIVVGALVVLVCVMLTIWAAACGVAAITPMAEPEVQQTTAEPEVQQISVDCRPYEREFRREAPASEAYFPSSQLVVTGPMEEVRKVVGIVNKRIPLREVSSCIVDRGSAAPSPIWGKGQLAMDLYAIEEVRPEEPIAQQLARMAEVLRAFEEARRGEYAVYADPNYFTGILGQSSCGSPHGIGPSPHGIGPSPHGIGPSPVPGSGPGAIHAGAAELFRTQWAFEHIGFSPWPSGTVLTGDPPNGAGVLVGVLDTSPFSGAPEFTFEARHGVSPPWTLELEYPQLWPLQPSGQVQREDISDHGLFAASLIHALAPESKIQLVRVLDEWGCGTLFDLNAALFRFIAQVHENGDDLDGAVINLSLGLQRPYTDTAVAPPVEEEAGMGSAEPKQRVVDGITGTWTRRYDLEEKDQAKSFETTVPPTRTAIYIDENVTVIVEDTVDSLQAAVALAHERGIVVVAAAGNDSGRDRLPRPPQLPAAFPSVIGVAGTNISRTRSCFSNWGDVSAPAGEGGPNPALMRELEDKYPGVYTGSDCLPVTDSCTGECPVGLIGLTWDAPDKGEYAYWSGTSFAAPLVSGLAVQVVDASEATGTPAPPDAVFAAIRCGAPTRCAP